MYSSSHLLRYCNILFIWTSKQNSFSYTTDKEEYISRAFQFYRVASAAKFANMIKVGADESSDILFVVFYTKYIFCLYEN